MPCIPPNSPLMSGSCSGRPSPVCCGPSNSIITTSFAGCRAIPTEPSPPEERWHGRNYAWKHLSNDDVILMPDTWEYPWYASWDLAFHCVTLSRIDPDFAKKQLLRMGYEWYQHGNGQYPAYEWNFDDVNPPVLAWAALVVYRHDLEQKGQGDYEFLAEMFHSLMLNYSWWINRKDADGRDIFGGGFLGMDNIGVFDRDQPLPDGGTLGTERRHELDGEGSV